MRPLNLHIKTTVLTSLITVTVLCAALAITSGRVAELLRDEQKARAELQALNLAGQISQMPEQRDPRRLAQIAALVRGARPGVTAVRIWERVGGVYVPVAEAEDSPPESIPDETIDALRSGLASDSVRQHPADKNESLYRVFVPISEQVPITEQSRFSGAVELVERLDDAPSIAVRYEQNAIWMALIAVALITLAVYLLFRRLVRAPVQRLLDAMSRAEEGDLFAEAKTSAPDELGRLTRGFNSMISKIRAMTEEREGQRQLLEERVKEKTAELQKRNEQLVETNRELWERTRRVTELERQAAAGQTAAHFAHEVGTPLNLISGHVQLLRTHLSNEERAEPRLGVISAQIERIERIVRRMLDRTRPEAIELSPLDLNELLRKILDATAPTLDARGIRVIETLDKGIPEIYGDADRLQQVFINLINNSLDAMPQGGELRVETVIEAGVSGSLPDALGSNGGNADTSFGSVSKSSSAKKVVVLFADTGYGMTEDVRTRILDSRFTTKERGRGTGLGLMVVRQVMREHEGHIRIESQPGLGTSFYLVFPPASESGASRSDESAARELVGASLTR